MSRRVKKHHHLLLRPSSFAVSPSPGPPSSSLFRKSAFTLAELMVVVVIMALLLFLALPAFQGIGRGSKLQTAAFQLRTTLTLARQIAITQRRVVSMILPDQTPALYQGDGAGHVDKALRAYVPYSFRDGYLAEWKYLPPGVLFNPFVRPMTSVQNVFQYKDFYTNVPFAVSGSAIKTLPSVRFRPDGLTGGSDIVGLYLMEGVMEGLTPIFRTNSTVLSLDIVAVTGRIISREHLPAP